jgi:peroxiredoxin
VWPSLKHVPGFIEKAEELKSKGVDEILLISGIVYIISSEFCILDSCL